MKIGELATKTGCDVETIRYYEKSGILAVPERTANGYREYQAHHQERLQFIRHCRSLQMGLADIRILLDLQSNPAAGCQSVDDLLDSHIVEVQARVKMLLNLEQQLLTLRDQCSGPHSTRDCGILQNLNVPTDDHGCVCHDKLQ
ncbi:putative transcription regulator protein (CadR and PbrR family) [Herminiimonas arsenicoxydans]|uniref:Transcription regulator protein (CadR and PbrR family) n=1 Tax=Herminiimonas arsenicoxydans TaxID=204773 RepID=A4G5G5_HERAR|nr:putative transcription regulator protein (CadR and PbrR family) [Herminiimonas arsenicoxydans]